VKGEGHLNDHGLDGGNFQIDLKEITFEVDAFGSGHLQLMGSFERETELCVL
jgi:hypothetical protein